MTRALLEAAIRPAEGCALRMYLDTTGHWTVGWGHNLSDVPISQRAADVIFQDDVDGAIRSTFGTFPWLVQLDDCRQRAVVELVFNLGVATLATFGPTLEHLRTGQYDDAATHLAASKWFRDVGPVRGGRIVEMVRTGRDI